jgi:predicted RNA-binding Zn-ribbon protein involved in translation (DUF1610 family)
MGVRHSLRPDPDEPYRYRCPDCDDHKIRRLRNGSDRPYGKTYPFSGRGEMLMREDQKKKYYCPTCGKQIAAVRDARTGNTRTRV